MKDGQDVSISTRNLKRDFIKYKSMETFIGRAKRITQGEKSHARRIAVKNMSRRTRIKSLSIIFLSALSSENFLILLIFISDIRAQTTPVYDTDFNNEEIFSNPIKSKGLWFNGVAATLLPPSSQAVTGWECNCWNATNEFKDELECKCQGEALLRIPQKLYASMQRLTIASAGLPVLRSTGLAIYATSLRDIVLSDLPRFESIQERAFETLKLLRTIYISHAPKLTYLSKDVFKGISETLKTIRIVNSGLVRIPDMRYLSPHSILQMIDLEGNHIERIYRKSVLIKTEQLILDNNNINFIEDSAFSGSQIAKLSFKGNRNLEEIHSNAFVGIMNIQELDLSSTSLTSLPSYGLSDLEILRVQDTHTLKTIPSIYDFKNLQVAWLTHSFHCCAFQFPSRHDPIRHAQRMKEINKWQRACSPNDSNNQSPHQTSDIRTLKRKRTTTTNQIMENSDKFYNHFEHSELSYSNSTYFKNETYDARGLNTNRDYSDDVEEDLGQFHDTADISQDNQLDALCGNVTLKKIDVSCFPVPDALNPCEDVMGSDWLRISVWIVVFLAVVGNVAVLVVLLFTRSDSNSVQKFLMCHLAFADLCMGLYLLLIASIDAHSIDEYFNYAYDWQYGVGCKVAGFLTVFASHLSVFALTIITIERWLAITHALYLNKRIKIRPAAYIMAFGWMYSFIMSSFPLFGISNYSSTSICLPMEARDTFDVIYLVSIIAVNGAAFFIIAICYAQIYLSLGQETRHARNMSEMSIAKKMALLVFTNFSCWAPIAFFGLTALAGYPLINVTKSKILLVFFYPMNSCADPYLYAILTAQYRRDLYMLLSKLGLCKNKALQYRESVTLPVTNASYHVTTLQRNNSCNPSQAPQETKQMLQAEEFV